MSELVTHVLGNIRNRLLDLTRRNRLLNYKESSKSIRIVDELPDEVYRILVTSGKAMEFLPIELNEEGDHPNVVTGNELPKIQFTIEEKHVDDCLQTPFGDVVLEKRCKKLLQEARTAIEETGSNMLYLAIGFLEWYESGNSNEKTRAPLILLPASIEKTRLDSKSNCFTYTLSYSGEDIEPNISLEEMLKAYFDIILPELDKCKTPEEYLEIVAEAVSHKTRWRVAREMVLGLFSFSKLLMYRDLDPSRWPDLANHNNISCILAGRTEEENREERPYGEEYDLDRDPKAISLPLITDADSSQTSVIIDAVHHGKNLVVEGPPGTGKSQTITNIIAAALHKGLSVLFVAEKKAALEVVRSRLDHAGLGDFCLELHSHKTQKGLLHADIAKRLNKHYSDSTILDRQIEELTRERNSLMAYSNLVNSVVGQNKETIYDIFWTVERCRNETGGRDIRLTINNPLELTRNQINDRTNLLMQLAKIRFDLSDEAINVLSAFKPDNMLPGDEKSLVDLLQKIKTAAKDHQEALNSIMENDCPLDSSITMLRKLNLIQTEKLPELPVSFKQQLAPTLSQLNSSLIIKNLHKNIEKYRCHTEMAKPVIQSCGRDLAYDDYCQIINAADSLVKMGFDKELLSGLLNIRQNQKAVIELLKDLAQLLQQSNEWFNEDVVSVKTSGKVLEFEELLLQSPFEEDSPCRPEYVLPSTPNILKEARECNTKLLADLQQHGSFFLLRYVSKTEELDALACSLREYRGSFFAFLSSRFRSLKREAQRILVNPDSVKSKNLIERIESLSDTLKAISSFSGNQAYVKILGSAFDGINTKWEQLDPLITWSQKLPTVVGSVLKASELAQALPKVTKDIIASAKAIKSIRQQMSDLGVSYLFQNSIPLQELIDDLAKKSAQCEYDVTELSKHQGLIPIDVETIASSTRALLLSIGEANEINMDPASTLLGENFRGAETDTESLLSVCTWFRNLRDAGLSDLHIDWLASADTPIRFAGLKDILASNLNFWRLLASTIEQTKPFGALSNKHPLVDSESDKPFSAISTSIDDITKNQSSLSAWNDYCTITGMCTDLGLSVLTELIRFEKPTPLQAGAIYRQAAYESMARDILRLHPELATFTRAGYEGIRERYAATDRMIMEQVRFRIAHNTSSHPIPRGTSYGPVKNHTDYELLKRELNKKKRHIPIRQLVHRAVGALKAIKPCFMMSPLSVAQYLDPRRVSFDLVIMDEASQLKPEDALGAIARAKQLIVVGDPKQLPPTSFFDRNDSGLGDDEETMAIQDTESILDICMTSYSKRRLRWHYRSAHESLIAFSNNRFYDDDLIIFPSPLGADCNYGVHSHYIAGAKYHKGRNMLEAEVVAKAILEHFRNNIHNSLGVATFNREQAELISDILDRYQKENPWLQEAIKDTDNSEEPFFIKNLENVQGDERDVIFVSTTYGPDKETDKVYQRFGPIAGNEGWRRLNVIFTRAKKKLELFTSMRPADIKLSENPSKGTVALKEYLDYAETGRLPSYGTVSCKEPDSDFEISVAHHLSLHGYKTVGQVGVAGFFIDIGVVNPERDDEFILGIECDGATYHSAKSVRDRDRLRQEILEKKGWNIHRIWSTDWFKNRDNEVQRLVKAVRDAVRDKSVVDDSRSFFKDFQILDIFKALEKESSSTSETNGGNKTSREQQTSTLSQQGKSKGLKAELIEYRLMNITPSYPDNENNILRDEILNKLIVHKPTTKNEFYTAVPMKLRQETDGRQMQYLDDILEIIDGYTC